MSLSSLIVQREVATMRQVEEALARQVIYGGDFVTNLLEVARLDEGAVATLLAESVSLSAAPPGELPIPQASVRALVPAEMATQRTLVPLVIEAGKLVVAVAEPLPSDVEEQLGFALGLGIDQRAAPTVRVRQAIARVYGVPLERRMERLLARLSGELSNSGSMPPPLGAAPKVLEAPRPPSAPPPRLTSRGFPAARAASVVPPESPETTTPSQPPPPVQGFDSEPPSAPLGGHGNLLQRDVGSPGRAVRRRRGPLTLDGAKAEAEEAADRDALLDLYFDFSRQFFDYAALFLVHGDIAEGRDAFGTGASREKVLGIGVPLDLPGLLSTARDKRGSVVARPPADGLDAVLLTDLLRPRDTEMAIVPLVVRTRAVALLVGDCGEAGIDRGSVQQIVTFSGVIGKAFERIIVRRKLDGFIAGSRGTAIGRVDPVQVAPKKRTEPPPAPPPPPAPAPVSAPSPAPPDAAPSRRLTPTAPIVAAPIVAPRPPPVLTPPGPPLSHPPSPEPAPVSRQPPSMASTSAPPPPVANVASMRMVSGPPIPREEPTSPGSMPVARPISIPPVTRSEAPQAKARSVPPPLPPPPQLEVVQTDEREDPDSALFDELGWETGLDDDPADRPPPSAAIAVAAHTPPNRHSVRVALPSVIVDLEQEVRGLIARVAAGEHDDSAEGELLRLGERAMRSIMDAFPGPLTFERARIATMPVPPRASDCGLVLRLVARQRKVALPFVLEKLESDSAEERGWATHLLVELPYLEALPYAILALRDPDAATRTSAALAIASIARMFPDEVAVALNELAHAKDPADRVAAVMAMAELREAALVPELIRALGDGDEGVVAAAQRALTLVTRQDLGADARRWVKWWEQNALRHRVEWLIDALMHEVSEIRRGAGEELKSLTKEYFGFAAELPARDRERAQQRYRDWWITEGKARFRRKA